MTLVIAAVAAIAATAVTVSLTVLFLVSGAARRAHCIATMSVMFLSKAHNMAQSCARSEAQAHTGLGFVHVVARVAHPMSIVVARTTAHSMRITVVARTVAHSIAHPMRSTVMARTIARVMAHHRPTWVATMLMAMARAVAHHSRFGFVTLFFLIVRLFISRARIRRFLISVTIVIELFAFFFVALH